eukprot:Skav219922  [mRNA]  locus=scaffold2006:166516:166842:- [translate_table: standard]
MGNQQSGEAPSSPTAPLPVLLGQTRQEQATEVGKQHPPDDLPPYDLPDVDEVESKDLSDLIGPYLFTMFVPFLLVLSVSALLPVPPHWDFSFVALRLGLLTRNPFIYL